MSTGENVSESRSLRQALNRAIAWLALVGLIFLSGLSLYAWPYQLELLSHFKPQYVLASCFLPLAFWQLKSRWGLGFSLGLLVWGLFELMPWYLPPAGVAVQSGPKILLANMLFANPESAPLQKLIKQEQPDLIVLMEIHDRHLTLMKRLRPIYPYFSQSDSGVGGVGAWSKTPLQVRAVKMGPAEFPTLLMQLSWQGESLELIATHPAAPVDKQAFRQRNQEFSAINDYLRSRSGRHLLLGDLNVTPWSPYYRRLVQGTNLSNGRIGFGIQPTWPVDLPALLRLPLDHVLISPGLGVQSLSTGPQLGSDHLPLIFKLVLSD